nr:retinol dehydrogenase 14-like [Cherax quadricarinatus]
MATNHFGHFLLTNMLLGLLKASAPSRVVTVSSGVHQFGSSLDVDDLNYEKNPFPKKMVIYSQSKLANILFTKELSEKLRGTDVTANSVHPGVVYTEIMWKNETNLFTYIFAMLVRIMGKDEKLGAQTSIYLAVSEEVNNVTGKYYADCKTVIRPHYGIS